MARPWPSGQFEFKTMSHVHMYADANLGNIGKVKYWVRKCMGTPMIKT